MEYRTAVWPKAGGELSKLIREFDWSSTSLGPLIHWPELLRSTVELLLQSPVPMVLLWNADGVMIYNDAYSTFAGGRHPQLLGSPVLQGWPEVADFNRHVMETGMSGGTLVYRDQHLILNRRGNPEEVWLDLYYSPVVDDTGAPRGVLAIVVETTDRMLAERRRESAEAAQRRSEESLSFALDAGGGVGTWDWDIPNDRVHANSQFARLFSVDPQRAAEGAPLQDFVTGIHPDDRERVAREIQSVLQAGGDFKSEYRVLPSDGAVRWVYARGRAYLNAEGRAFRFPGVVFDITELKAAQIALKESEDRFRAMFAQAPMGVALTTKEGKILEANHAFLSMLGRTGGEIMGSDSAPVTHPDDVTATRQFLKSLWSGEAQSLTLEKRYLHKKGHLIWARATGTVLRDQNGVPAQVIVIIEDISDRKRAEQRLQAQFAVSRALAAGGTLQSTAAAVLGEISSALGWTRGALWLVDDHQNVLRSFASWRNPNTEAGAFDHHSQAGTFARGEGLPGRVWQAHAPEWIADLDRDPNFPRIADAQAAGLRSGFAFPITGMGTNVLGVMEFFGPAATAPDEDLLHTSSALGRQIGQYLQRQHAEEELRHSELTHRAVLETALDCIVTIDQDSRIREFNPAAAQAFGRSRAEVIGQDMAQLLIPPQFREQHYRGMARYFETGESRVLNRRIEVSALRAGGEEFPIELAITRIDVPGPALFTAYIRDITERRRSENLLQERMRLAALQADVGVALTTAATFSEMLRKCTDAIVEHLQAAFARIWTVDGEGATLELQASSGLYTHINGGHARVPIGQFKIGLIAAERRPHLTNDVLTDPRVGDRNWAQREGMVAFAGYPLIVEDALIGVIGLFAKHELGPETLTALESIANSVALGIERKRAEAALREARDAAEAANRAKSDFLASMSHELRTPLNAIIGYSEMLQEEVEEIGEEAMLKDLNKIHSAGRHLLGLINDILDLSKIEAGRMELFPEAFPVEAAVRDVAGAVEPLVAKNSNELRVEIEPDIGEMYTDLTKTRQILFNLLSNAAKFTANGKITLRVERDNTAVDAVRFTVTDTGNGIPKERLGQLFQPFTQLHNPRRVNQAGTGLGLAITKRFCEMMGGSITVQTAVGAGSTFSVLLPRSIRRDEEHPENAAATSVPGGKSIVLVIDDDPAARELMRRYLAREDVTPVLASGGEEGLRLARQLRPQLITLDVVMPGMDGWSVLQALKSDPELSGIPVIMTTIVAEQGLGYALGAADYLLKPIAKDKLHEVLRRHDCFAAGRRVLLVEDDADSRSLLSAVLGKQGCQVTAVADGLQALHTMSASRPDVILLDLLMPNMDGFAFIAELQTRDDWRTIPVVVVTAKDLTVEDRRRLNGRVIEVLQKGGNSEETLLKQIQELTTRLLSRRSPSTIRGE